MEAKNSITLDKNEGTHRARKHKCPRCGKKRFVAYYDFEKGEYLPDRFGRCDRQDNCGYFLTPFGDKLFMREWNGTAERQDRHGGKKQERAFHVMPYAYVEKSMQSYEGNVFASWVIGRFGKEKGLEILRKYRVGTSATMGGAAVFWQVDGDGLVRSGKVIAYERRGDDIKRIKGKKAQWVHFNMIKKGLVKEYRLAQCFFGEHLLRGHAGPVAIVESEKTAIIASYFFRDHLWLGAGSDYGLGGKELNLEKCRVLQGREVHIYPDFSQRTRALWREIGVKLTEQLGCRVKVSGIMAEKDDGSDLADYLVKYPVDKKRHNLLTINGYPASWETVLT